MIHPKHILKQYHHLLSLIKKFNTSNLPKLSSLDLYKLKNVTMRNHDLHSKNNVSISSLIFNSDVMSVLQRQKILLRGAMVKVRKLRVPIPMTNQYYVMPYTLSNLAGHASFLALAVSYLESDFLSLRIYAFSGITLSIIFQYYREIPLWIPIQWNSLFLLINATMIILLLIEENEALNIPKDELTLLHNVFSNHGHLKAVDFRHLMSISTKHKVNKHEILVKQGDKNNKIHLVKSGRFLIQHNNETIGKIKKFQFVGAMSFLSWEGDDDMTSYFIEPHAHAFVYVYYR